jgi:hypothetical protein
MANSYLNMTRSTTLPVLLRRSLSAARHPTNSDGYGFLATSAADKQAELVAIVNDAVEEMLDVFPFLNVASTALTLVASQQYVLLPTTLRATDILRLTYNNGDDYDGTRIKLVSPAEAVAFDREWRNRDATSDYPLLASVSWEQSGTQGKIEFWPKPASAKTLSLLYRTNTSPFRTQDILPVAAALTPVIGTGWDAGTVTSCTITTEGSGYDVAPTITIAAPQPGGLQATATCTLNAAGGIATVTITANGDGYVSSYATPTATLSALVPRYCAIPDDMLRLAALYVADELAGRSIGLSSRARGEIAQEKERVAEMWVRRLAGTMDQFAYGGAFERVGSPTVAEQDRCNDFDFRRTW